MQITVSNEPVEYDVIIAGGGPAGVAAGIAAGRLGAKTLIIEQTTALGGMATSGMVSRMTRYTDEENLLYRSLALEILDRYKAFEGFNPDFYGKTPLFTENLKLVLDEMVTEAGCDVLFQSFVSHVVREQDEITSLIVSNKAGLTPYRAKMYVDCTGDADVACFAGVPTEKGAEDGALQPMSLCYVISGVHVENAPEPGDVLSFSTMKWREQWKVIEKDDRFPLVFAHFVPVLQGSNIVYVNAGHLFDVDATDPVALSRAYMLGRKIAHQTLEALKVYLPDVFYEAFVTATAPLMGVRETRRIEGEYRLTVEDYIERRSFEDEVCRNHNWLDNHTSPGHKNPVKGIKLAPGESHGIPFRTMIPVGLKNLLVAGRSISMERGVFASVRVMPNCISLGEAAGIGAALAARDNTDVHGIRFEEVLSHMAPLPKKEVSAELYKKA